MLRKTLAVLAGLVAGFVVIGAVESISNAMYPLPPGLDPHDPEALAAHVASLPLAAFLIVLLAYALGSLAAGAAAALAARRASVLPAVIAGGLLTTGGVMTLAAIPHPLWFSILSTALYVPLAWLAARLLRRTA